MANPAKEAARPPGALKAHEGRRITPENFSALLDALGGGDAGASAYERLRSKLILFFTRRLLRSPEDIADEVLDRLAARLGEGIAIASIDAFALGIARHVAMEQVRAQSQVQAADDTFWNNVPAASDTQDSEAEIARMERCLEQMPFSEANLLRSYYLTAGKKMISTREQLAKQLGISPVALRQRVFQARQQLKACMTGKRSREGD